MYENYRNRIGRVGSSNREALENQSVAAKEILFENTRSYRNVIVDGERYDARVISDVRDTVKTGDGNYIIEFRNGVMFYPGTYVQMPNMFDEEIYDYWLIIDVIENFTPQFLIKKCSYELKWKNSVGEIIRRWITFDDSYKIYDGLRNYGYKTNLPESSLVIKLPLDDETKNIRLDKRFIMDLSDIDEIPDVFEVTNRSVLPKHYKGHGIIELALSKTQFNHKTDNAELMIADFFVEEKSAPPSRQLPVAKRAEIAHSGKDRIVMGTPYKDFSMKFYDEANQEIYFEDIQWEVMILPEFVNYFDYVIENNVLRIKAEYNENLQSYKFKIVGSSPDNLVKAEMYIKVVSGI